MSSQARSSPSRPAFASNRRRTAAKPARWFPNVGELDTPAKLERAIRQVLEQQYAVADRMTKVEARPPDPQAEAAQGPTNTKLCGLDVEPVDTQTLANGATLKYNSARGTFSFQ